MDHPIAVPELVRPWRTATLVATAIAGLELVLLVVAGMILLGKSLAPQVHAAAAQKALAPKVAPAVVTPAPAKAATPSRVVSVLPRAKTGVLVLNGNGVPGAAAQAAALVTARGYPVKEVGNAPTTGYPTTRVMFAPGFEREAKRFAKDLNFGVPTPLDGMKAAQLRGARVLLLLGTTTR